MPARLATADDVELVAAICAAGFAADPVMSWVLRDDARREDQLRVAFTGLAHSFLDPGHVIHVVDDACVALWRGPGVASTRTDRGPDPAPSPFPPEETERFRILGELMEIGHPTEDHWYLNVLATVPARQGQGLGARALAPVVEVCDADGVPAYLESSNPRNMTLYRRAGFDEAGLATLDLPEGPSLHPMWRTPRPA